MIEANFHIRWNFIREWGSRLTNLGSWRYMRNQLWWYVCIQNMVCLRGKCIPWYQWNPTLKLIKILENLLISISQSYLKKVSTKRVKYVNYQRSLLLYVISSYFDQRNSALIMYTMSDSQGDFNCMCMHSHLYIFCGIVPVVKVVVDIVLVNSTTNHEIWNKQFNLMCTL